MSQIENKIALITGGASGIGKLMGLLLLEKKLDCLVIWDINPLSLEATAVEFKEHGYKVYPYIVDIMNTADVIKYAQIVKQEVGTIDILINNAGIIVGKLFADYTHLDIEKTMGINSNASMHITAEFLPAMIAQRDGHIINIASAAGMVSNPKLSVYAASKWAVIGWSDSLQLEMAAAKTNVKITTVTPYYINTGMFDGVQSKLIPIVEPSVAAKKIINGIENNKRFVRLPWIVYLVPLFKGILPASWFDVFVGKWIGMHHTMDDFRGRK